MANKPDSEPQVMVLCECVLDDREVRHTALRLAVGATRPGEDQEARALATAEAMYRFLTGTTVH